MSIQEILKSNDYTDLEKKVAIEKWKFGQLPSFYRKDHKQEILEKIKRIQEQSCVVCGEKIEIGQACEHCGHAQIEELKATM